MKTINAIVEPWTLGGVSQDDFWEAMLRPRRRVGHAPDHIRDTFLTLLEGDDLDRFEARPLLYFLTGRSWACTDIMPSDSREVVADFLEAYPQGEDATEIRQGCTYARAARRLRPHLAPGARMNAALEEAVRKRIECSDYATLVGYRTAGVIPRRNGEESVEKVK